MKTFSTIFLITFASLLPLRPNLVQNPSFEDADESAKRPASWLNSLNGAASGIPDGVNVEMVLDEEEKRNGEKSLRITHTETAVNFSTSYQTIAVKTNTIYKVSVFAKVSSDIKSLPGGAPRLYITGVGGKQDSLVIFEPMDTDWSFLNNFFNSKDFTSVKLQVYLHNTGGTVWYDDVVLEEAVPVTNRNWAFDEEGTCNEWIVTGGRGSQGKETLAITTQKMVYIHSPLFAIPSKAAQALRIVIKSSHNGTLHINLKRQNGGWMGNYAYPIIGDNLFHEKVFLLNEPWAKDFEQARFALTGMESGTLVEIRSIEFLSGPPANHILNGSFENFRKSTGITPWSSSVSQMEISVASGKASGGNRSLRIRGQGRTEISTSVDFDRMDETQTWVIAFSYLCAKTDTSETNRITLTFYDALEKELENRVFDIPPGSGNQFKNFNREFSPHLLTKRIAINLNVNFIQKNEMYFDEFSLTKKNKSVSESPGVGNAWQAEWIRPGAGNYVTGNMYFRKTFYITNESSVASLIVTSDDFLTGVYVNGKDLGLRKNAANLWDVDRYEIAHLLIKGKNTLSISTLNPFTDGGLLCELGIIFKNGSYQLIKSDPSFKSTTNIFPDWTASEYNDSAWQQNSFSYGTPPVLPWRDRVKHDYIGKLEPLEISAAQFPKTVTAGETNTLELTFMANEEEVTIKIYLESGESTFNLGERHLSGLLPGKKNTKKINLVFSEFLPKENCLLSVGFNKFWAIGKNIENNRISLPIRITRPPVPAVTHTAKTVFKNGIPRLSINGRDWALNHHWCGSFQGGIETVYNEAKLGNVRDNGIHQYFIMVFNFGGSNAWKGSYDFSAFDEPILQILQIDPEAHILLQFPVDMYYNKYTKEWKKQNPDELMRDESGQTQLPINGQIKDELTSWASEKWLTYTKKMIADLIRDIDAQTYGKRIIGYMPLAGLGTEWCYWGGFGQFQADYGKPFAAGFRNFCKNKYQSLAAINVAWKTNLASFDNIALPTGAERNTGDYFTFIDPAISMKHADFREFFSFVPANAIIEIGKTVKQVSKNNALYGTYYGYLATLLKERNDSGYFAIESLLNSPAIDFISGLVRYDNRRPGQESGTYMPYEGSMELHSKIVYIQSDLRTVRSTDDFSHYKAVDIHGSISSIQRELGRSFIDNTGFEFGYASLGWMAEDKRMMQVIGRGHEIERELWNIPIKTMDPRTSIAVIVDGKCSDYTITKSDVHEVTMVAQIPLMYHAGVGVDLFLLSDLDKIPDYKCYFFLNTFRITDSQKKIIETRLKKNNNTLVWVYAPGLIGNNTLDSGNISKITGIRMEVTEKEFKPAVIISEEKGPIKLPGCSGRTYTYTSTVKIGPHFIPADGKVLGTIEGSEAPGLVVRKFPEWTSVYSFVPSLPAFLVRAIAEYSGIHIANREESDTTYASDRLLCIHTANPGKRTIYLPPACQKGAREMFRNRNYPVKNGVLELEVEALSTYMFFFE